MRKKTVRDVDVTGKRVLVRVDYNVPLDQYGRVTDDTRISASLPTLHYLLDHGASLVLMSHLGRPKGKVVEELRLTPVAAVLRDLIGREVRKLDQVVGPEVKRVCLGMEPGEIVLLENLRFDPGETSNAPEFAALLARLGQIYVDDAFGAAHREHASVVGVAKLLPAVAGFLMESEIVALKGLVENPKRPFVTVLGGSKIADKLKVISRFQELVDVILLGGGMTYTIMKSQGLEIGDSLCEENLLGEVAAMMSVRKEKRARICLPRDLVVASEFKPDAESKVVEASRVPAGWMGLDIGPLTIGEYIADIGEAATIFWNGPMGVFEWRRFQGGTMEIGKAVAQADAVTVAGGGDTVAAIEKYELEEGFTHISTGGGASMEFLEGISLPGIEVLTDIAT
ncbi:MAG: phosphoglycerate kinase [Actinomycetota bacterium]|nr:phosphoglycerate kinase [Actinomycetota bacterium]